jgi:hypothetical protein
MDVLEEQAHLGPSLEQEAHRLDGMTQTLGDRYRLEFYFGGKREDLGSST